MFREAGFFYFKKCFFTMSCLVGGERQTQVDGLLKAMCNKLRFQELERLKCRYDKLGFTGASTVESFSACTHIQS